MNRDVFFIFAALVMNFSSIATLANSNRDGETQKPASKRQSTILQNAVEKSAQQFRSASSAYQHSKLSDAKNDDLERATLATWADYHDAVDHLQDAR